MILNAILKMNLIKGKMMENNWVKCASEIVIVSIGQLTPDDQKALDKAVRQGVLKKWRGHWAPVSGASWGIGPLKSCYGPPGFITT